MSNDSKKFEQFENLVKQLAANQLTLATAESLTGGMFSENITSVPNSSQVYKGGIVAYSTEVKNSILKTKSSIAVSKQSAQEMAENVRELFKTDIGVSTTGVAGPTKQDGQEVGTVYIGISTKNLTKVTQLDLSSETTRSGIRAKTCFNLLKLIENEVFK